MQSDLKIAPGKRIPQLDGLRGIAILMVMCYHFFPNNIICNFGWSGVDLFFVLSGFLITGRLYPYLDDKKILLKFYRNRFLRIVPLYFGFLVVFFIGWFVLTSEATRSSTTSYNTHWWQFFLFIQNWVFAADLIDPKVHLQHLWSVAIEEQIYLVFPLILIFIKNKVRLIYFLIFTLITIILARSYYYNFLIAEREYLKIFYNTFFRFDSFLCGVLIYFIYTNSHKLYRLQKGIRWGGLICFFILVTYFFITKNTEKNSSFISTVGYTIIAFMYSSLLFSILTQANGFMSQITSNSFLRYTGKISYGLYIFHWPLYLIGFVLIRKLFDYFNFPLGTETLHILNTLFCFAATYLVSVFIFKYYESYFLKRKTQSV